MIILKMLKNEAVVTGRGNSGNVCYCSLPNLLLSHLLSNNMAAKLNNIFTVFCLRGDVISYIEVKQITSV
jgi:hypothetical protein